LATTSATLNPIKVQEQEFIDSKTGDRFDIVGVAYQPGGSSGASATADPLSDPAACLRDAALMQALGINTIRVYNLSPTANHDECASIFDSVGIYMLLDVNSPLEGQYLNRADPQGSYNTAYLTHVFSVIEAFKDYPNLLGFNSGNEIINTAGTAKKTPPYIRAVQRDMKNYIANHADRTIPVGYSAADVADLLDDQWAYFQCEIDGKTDPSRSDFFGLNDYEWCGADSSYTISGYNVLVQTFSKSTIPVFFSEYGCNDPQPRLFDEVPTLYGPKMTALSGGLVYQWTQDSSDYGLVNVKSDGSAKLLKDYDTLQSQYQKVDSSLLQKANSAATSLTPPTCSASLITGGSFSTTFTLPKTPSGATDMISNGISNPPKGKIIAVMNTSVSQTVKDANGSKIKNLAITTGATSANYPGSSTTSKLKTESGSDSSSDSGSGVSSFRGRGGRSGSAVQNVAGTSATPSVLGAVTAFAALLAMAISM